MVAERQLLYGKRVFGLSFFFSNHDFNPAETNDTKPPLQSFEPNHSHPFKRERKCNFLLEKWKKGGFLSPRSEVFSLFLQVIVKTIGMKKGLREITREKLIYSVAAVLLAACGGTGTLNGERMVEDGQTMLPPQPVLNRPFARLGVFFEEVTFAQDSLHGPVLLIDRQGKTLKCMDADGRAGVAWVHNFSDGRALFGNRNGQLGYLNTKGEVEIPPVFDEAYDFCEGLALTGNLDAKGKMRYRLIGTDGRRLKTVLPSSALLDSEVGNGLLAFTDVSNGRCGYVDVKDHGVLWMPDSVLTPTRFRYGAAVVFTRNGVALTDRNGRLTELPEAMDAVVTGTDRVALRTDRGWLLADFGGRVLEQQPAGGVKIDSTALRLVPQLFYREPKWESEANEKAASKEAGVLKENAEKGTCTVDREAWRRIGKQNPFYEEARKVVSGKLTETDAENRRMILNYVEKLRTSYTTKDMDFLSQVFSDKALIIVGKVVRQAPRTDGTLLPEKYVEYNVKSKRAYLSKLQMLFRLNKEIELDFSNFHIMRHPTQRDIYGVTLRQKYRSDAYADDGYLFLLWDFSNPKAPLIHVRTWQPAWIDKQTPLPPEEVFHIRNFNLQ